MRWILWIIAILAGLLVLAFTAAYLTAWYWDWREKHDRIREVAKQQHDAIRRVGDR